MSDAENIAEIERLEKEIEDDFKLVAPFVRLNIELERENERLLKEIEELKQHALS